jgi:UDP-N-acetylmuramate dehydrogenase
MFCEQVELSQYAAYRVGGVADFFAQPQTENDLLKALEEAHAKKLKTFILGSGTNLLIRDGGVRGVVIYLGPRSADWKMSSLAEDDATVLLRVPSAFSKARLLDLSLASGWSGLEFSAGIPGTLGGAVFMNAGTRWGSYAQVIEKVRLWYPQQGVVEKSVAEMGFKYRGHGEALSDGAVVLSVDLRLKKTQDAGAASCALVDRILSYRGSRQALERPSCGSVFKNPENSERGAGRLIEAAGLKGLREGGAQVSTRHANFILNTGTATAFDIETLIKKIQFEVAQKFSIQLETEVIFVGENVS